ncbi:MAG: hypothetical protein AAGJ40_23005 [Planctomycetota bacterium]
MELIVVLAMLVALAGLVIPNIASSRIDASIRTTNASMVAIRDAMIRYWTDTKYLALDNTTAARDIDTSDATEPDSALNRFQIRWLFVSPVSGVATPDYDPDTRLGWNGPYVVQRTGDYQIDIGSNFTTLYGNADGPALLNAISTAQSPIPTPLIVQAIDDGTIVDCRVVSAGDDGVIDIPNNKATTDLNETDIDDDQFVAFTLRR